MTRTRHFSHYINWGQVLTVGVGGYLAARALKLEEFKAGMEHKPLTQVIAEDAAKVKDWWHTNVRFGI